MCLEENANNKKNKSNNNSHNKRGSVMNNWKIRIIKQQQQQQKIFLGFLTLPRCRETDTGQNPPDHEQNPRRSAELNVEHG